MNELILAFVQSYIASQSHISVTTYNRSLLTQAEQRSTCQPELSIPPTPTDRVMSGAEQHVDDGFTSITWDQPPNSHHAPAGIFTNNERPPLPESVPSSVDRAEARPGAMEGASREGEHTMPSWGGKWMAIEVREPTKEHEGSKEMYVSYAVRTRVSVISCVVATRILTDTWLDKSCWVPYYTGHCQKKVPGLCIPQRPLDKAFPRLRRPAYTGQA